jgi:hypothetical protein
MVVSVLQSQSPCPFSALKVSFTPPIVPKSQPPSIAPAQQAPAALNNRHQSQILNPNILQILKKRGAGMTSGSSWQTQTLD